MLLRSTPSQTFPNPQFPNTSRYLLAEKHFTTISIYEQRNVAGEGVWKHASVDPSDTVSIPQVDPHQPLEQPTWSTDENGTRTPSFSSPMYDDLETNIPHPIMRFSDKPFPPGLQVLPHRTVVSRYLDAYAADVKHLIKLETQVLDVRLDPSSTGAAVTWLVKSRNLSSNSNSTSTYDAIAVCTGHYTVPYVPKIPGIIPWNDVNPGIITHSKSYRKPTDFAGKKVLVVGTSASGFDIAAHVAPLWSRSPRNSPIPPHHSRRTLHGR